MTNLKRLTLATLFALSAISLLAGCGDPNGTVEQTPSCSSSKDCKDGELCTNLNGDNKGFCEKKCTPGQANACETGKTCTTFVDNNGADVGSACLKKCTTDEECGTGKMCGIAKQTQTEKSCLVQPCSEQKKCPSGYKCNTTTKSCEAKATTQEPAEEKTCTAATVTTDCGTGPLWQCVGGKCKQNEIKTVVIKDLGTDCKTGDKGSDILGVSVVKPDGTILAWGRNVAMFEPTAGDQASGDYRHPGSPNGKPPGFNPNKNFCPDKIGKKAEFSSTGCNGIMAFQFDSVTTIGEKGTIDVYEFNNASCSNTVQGQDTYNVYGCKDDGILTEPDYTSVESYLTTNCVQLNTSALTGNTQTAFPKAP